MATALH